MVKTGHSAIRRVRFLPPGPSVGDIEVNTLRGIRDRGGPHEFLTPQRLDFDLLVHIESGSARHTVDFTDYPLGAGDVLWVRAGQVHQWGAIDRHRGDRRDVRPPRRRRAHQGPHQVAPGPPAKPLARGRPEGTPVSQALDLLVLSGRPQRRQSTQATPGRACPLPRRAPRPARARRTGRRRAGDGPTHEAYTWFRDHIEEHFRSGTRSASTPTGWATPPAPSTASPGSTPASPRRSSSTSASCSRPSGSSATPTPPVAEIAEQLGFDDASNFSSYFRRQTRMTPGTFRARSRVGSGSVSP